METQTVGKWAFIIGVLIAIVTGLFDMGETWSMYLTWTLVVLGFIVGFLNVTDKEATGFLVATIALMSVGGAGLEIFGDTATVINNILKNIVAFVAPAALVVALKAVYGVTRD